MPPQSRIEPEWAVALRALLKERSKGEAQTWGFVAAFMEMIDEVVASASEKQAHPDTVISKIIRDIKDRKGLGDEWDDIDVDIRNEIIAEWRGFFNAANR